MSIPEPPYHPSSTLQAQIFSCLAAHSWKLTRQLASPNPNELSGTLHGSAKFHPRAPPTPEWAGEMLYVEEGEMVLASGIKLTFSKRYVWRMRAEVGNTPGVQGADGDGNDETNSALSVWFIKPGSETRADCNGGETDYLFHGLRLLGLDERRSSLETGDQVTSANGEVGGDIKHVTARGHHLCVEDVYETEYLFRIRKSSEDDDLWTLVDWEVRHRVTGPKKDQDIWNVYEKSNDRA